MGSQASKGGVTAEGKAADAAPDAAGAKTNGQVGTVTATHPHLYISLCLTYTHPTSHTHISAAPLMPVWVSGGKHTHTHTLHYHLFMSLFFSRRPSLL